MILETTRRVAPPWGRITAAQTLSQLPNEVPLCRPIWRRIENRGWEEEQQNDWLIRFGVLTFVFWVIKSFLPLRFSVNYKKIFPKLETCVSSKTLVSKTFPLRYPQEMRFRRVSVSETIRNNMKWGIEGF